MATSKTETTIHSLLQSLFEKNNAWEHVDLFPQRLAKPKNPAALQSIDGKAEHELSPMLRARFSFGDRWTNACPGSAWLGIEEINKSPQPKGTLQQIKRRQKFWSEAEPLLLESSKLSLFSIDKEEQDETYLYWGGKTEPIILSFVSHDKHTFANFQKYLEWLLVDES